MATLVFYRQKRRDGGIRTGLEIDERSALHRFFPGNGDSDPILEWFVDVRAEGRRLPKDPEAARQWLSEQSETVRQELLQLAEQLQGGIDLDSWPVRRVITHGPRGIRWTISCSAVRRLEARSIAEVLRDLANNWSRYLKQLRPIEAVVTHDGQES